MSGIFRVLAAGIVGLVVVVPAGTAQATPVQLGEPTPACAIDYAWRQMTPSQFTGHVNIRNTGTVVINGWTLRFTLPEPQRIATTWNATFETFSGPIVAHHVVNNGVVEPGNNATLGFHADGTGKAINDFTVNGTACVRAEP